MTHTLVIGAGLAGMRTIEELRRNGYTGRITLVGDEQERPYDRPPLSKEVLVGASAPDSVYFRTDDQLASLDVELRLGATASTLHLGERRVAVGADRIGFDHLVIATGASARTLPEAEPLDGIHVLRTLGDAVRLKDELGRARHVVVVGAGFIGSEVAASARARGVHVTIVEQAPAPLARVLGVEMGAACAALHAAHGTELLCGVTVDRVVGAGRVEGVRLSDGRTLATDAVVVGVGVVPNTAWLDGSGLRLQDGVVCDAALSAGPPGVYAIGDVARWDNRLFDETMRVEQWTNAAEQARHVAAAISGANGPAPFLGSNYFWSDQYGVRIQFTGIPVADEVVVIDGSVESARFAAWYRRDERLVGALTIASPKLARRSKLLIEQRSTWRDALRTLDG